MRNHWCLFVVVAGVLAGFSASSVRAQTALVSAGAVWKYLDDGSDQLSTAPSFSSSAYNDGAWASGPAPLGYGEEVNTTVDFGGDGANKHITTYFRHAFNVADASGFTNLLLRVRRDDGVIVHLNGTEIFRDNMVAGAVTYQTLAPGTAADDGAGFTAHSLTGDLLVDGQNILAVQIHQANLDSSDIIMDLSLDANFTPTPPTVAIVSPTASQVLIAGNINITAEATYDSGSITKVEFFEGATKLGESLTSPYTVSWPNVSPGNYTLSAQVTGSLGSTGTSAPLAVTVNPVPESLLVPPASSWRYWKGTSEASNPLNAWRIPGYNDSAWLTGASPFYYENGSGFSGNTQLTDMFGGYTCIFMRKTFNLASATAILDMTLDVDSDDGCVVWINGVEVARVNMPGGVQTYQDVSLGAAGEPNQLTMTISDTSMLVTGENVLAVQGFNSSIGSSSDFIIEASLDSSVDNVSPVVESIEPLPGSILLELDFVNVVFNEAVMGVGAGDLRVNNEPPSSMTMISPREYTFHFSQPSTGAVNVAWVETHGITDTSPFANAFDGGNWTYTLDPNASTKPNLVISEFLASNNTGLEDEDGNREDWVEILNLGPLEANLGGWFLTDDAADLMKWEFPDLILPANNFLLVWASDKDRRDPSNPLHANFRLSAGGEYLALVDPQGNVVSEFSPTYPQQFDDISYGRDVRDLNLLGYFDSPTPGDNNQTSGSGFAQPPILSLESGVYTDNSLTLTITPAAGTTVRYATNGAIPTTSSPVAPGSITFSRSAIYKFRAYASDPNLFPSEPVVRTFMMLDSSAANFSSTLPVIILNTHGGNIPASVIGGGARRDGSLAVFDTFRGRSSVQGPLDFIGEADYEIFGQTSAGFAKQPHNIEVQDAFGNDKAVSLLGLPAEADWKMRNPWSDKCLINDFLGFEVYEDMGNYSVRRRLVEVFRKVSVGTGKVTYPGDYYGVLLLVEKIERDNDRVDIAELTPTQNSMPEISGGYIFKKDKDSTGDRNFTLSDPGGGHTAQVLKMHEPKPREVTDAQVNWLRDHLNQFQNALYASDWLTRADHYSNYIDVDSFVDSHWIVEFSKQIDGYRISNFFSKDRGGKIKNNPIWDWNLAWGNANYLDGGHTNNWYYTQISANNHIFLRRLINGTSSGTGTSGDPDFNQKIADRWSVLRTNAMNGPRLLQRIDELHDLLLEPAQRNYSKYNLLGSYLWPNPGIPPQGDGSKIDQRPWDMDYIHPLTYTEIMNQMKKWVNGRFLWVDSQFLRMPEFSSHGGDVQAGFNLTMQAPGGGTIHYTMNGQDPRLSGGGINPQAQTYGGVVTVNNNARIVARARLNNQWSGPAAATFVVNTPPLIVTELMYHPGDPALGDTNDVDNFEFIELKNIGTTTLNLAGFKFTEGIAFDFSTGSVSSLGPGQSVLLVKHAAAFTSRYGAQPNVAGVYTGSLANEGERLALIGPMEEVVHDFSYEDNWYRSTDGLGFSLVVADENQDRAAWDTRLGWRPSSAVGGSPGANNPAGDDIPGILISEALTHTDAPDIDSIELYNPTGSNVDIGGWFLSDDLREPKFEIPAGTIIPANGYLTFDEEDFNAPGSLLAFNLRSSGDEVYLFSGNGAGDLTGYMHGFDFGAALNGISFGRYVNSQGDEHFVAQAANSLGTANVGPKVGPVVISEIMYRPKDVFVNDALWNNTEDEFVELHNITGSPVPMFDPNAPTNTWRLRDAVSFRFPVGTTLDPDERVLIVSFDPAEPAAATAFRQKYGLAGEPRLFGPYDGQLSNGGEDLELIQPDLVRFYTNDIVITGVLIDKIDYLDGGTWPRAADGIGSSLQRVVETDYGNDPMNWAGANPSPGAGYVPGPVPVIESQPASQVVVATMNVSFSVSVSGAGPFQYQWLRNGDIVPHGTNATLNLSGVQPEQAGEYQVVVLTGANSVASDIASLEILIPANITLQPESKTVPPGENVTFAVAASSSSSIAYQWRKDGVNLPGATGASYTIVSAQPEDRGIYDVVVTDAVGSIVSQPAELKVLIPPILVHPAETFLLKVVQGSDVSLAVEVSQESTQPLTFRWRRGFAALTTVTNRSHQSFIQLLNVQPPTFYYDTNVNLTIFNDAAPNGVTFNYAYLLVLPDSDGDGMSDEFEDANNLNPNSGADADADLDGDGMTNLEESIAGTDPDDAGSYLKVEELSLAGGVNVVFEGVAGLTYSVLYKDQLSDAVWQKLDDVVVGASSRIVSVHDGGGDQTRYYRLVTPRQQ